MKRFILVVAWLAVAACGPSAAQNDTWSPIELTATPFTMPEQVGQLRFVAGFELESPQARFGGLSDLHVFDDGRLLAISDAGEWVLADIQFDPETGVPTGLSNARMALMRNEEGDPFPNKESGDAEDLAVLPDGRIAVSFEQTQTIRIYDLFGAGPMAPAAAGPPLAETERLGANRGLEALAVLPNGELLIGAERGRRAGPLPLWRTSIGSAQPTSPRYTLNAPLGYGLTALDHGANLWAVQRFYAPGLGTRIRVGTLAMPDQSGRAEFVESAEIAPPLAVDNIEGIAVRVSPQGERIYLISDDNFSEDQRTLLFVFHVPLN
jgi:hypothetical protein